MRRAKPLAFTIGGERWKWAYEPLRGLWGKCDYWARRITIDPRHESPKSRLDTELHEALHALQVFATEEHTAEVATTLAEILYGLGYRLTEPGKTRTYSGD